jgi:hypothetical protein
MQADTSRSAVNFVENSARVRATHHRGEAARFSSMAELEPLPSLRRHLLALAREYDKMAANLDVKPGRTTRPRE